MKPCETESKPAKVRAHAYTRALDDRKRPLRGIWKRNGNFIARITVEDDLGRKKERWRSLDAETAAQAVAERRRLLVDREDNTLPHIGKSPRLAAYKETYCQRLDLSGKRPATVTKEKGCLEFWAKEIGHLDLDKIRPHHVSQVLTVLKRSGKAGRTVNLYVIALRNLMKAARIDGFLKTLPTENIPWQKVDTKRRELVRPADLDKICEAATKASKNGRELADYLRLLAYSGARRSEALRLRWENVDFDQQLLTIGADGLSKNRETRHMNFNPKLAAHLKDMYLRRAPDSQWLFPSPQRGDKDVAAKTFNESLKLARAEAAKENPALSNFGFHDCRHLFISFAVMAGLDFMTIARWVGHKDGGILIGKVYGHLSSEHMQAQAARLNFSPGIVGESEAVTA